MNIIDARIILYNFIDTVASTPKGELHRLSHLKNSPEEIEAAYRLYFAHIVIFNSTEAPGWIDQFEVTISTLPMFVSDAIADEYAECNALLKKYNSGINKLLFKRRISDLRIRMEHVIRDIDHSKKAFLSSKNWPFFFYSGLLDEYREEIVSIRDWYVNTLTENPSLSFTEFLNLMATAGAKVYTAANIEFAQEDLDMFMPLHILPKMIKEFNVDSEGNEIISGFYKTYISEHFEQ